MCDDFALENVEHFMFDCKSLAKIQCQLWKEVIDTCPSEVLQVHILSMTSWDRATFILGCMNNVYVREWDPFYCGIANIIHAMYAVQNENVLSIT